MKDDLLSERSAIDFGDVLLIIDVQMDFLPEGALPVPDGEQVIPILNDYIDLFKPKNRIFATRDWHPTNHISFKEYGGPWPLHCIKESEGAKFHPDLRIPPNATVVSKGINPGKESLSGFDGTDLSEILRSSEASRVFVGGLATDYCVKNTVLDARAEGFEVVLLTDAIKGINIWPGDAELAIETMISKGADTITLGDLPEPLEIPIEEPGAEEMAKKPLDKADMKKKARLRSRGPYRKARVEQ